MESELNLYNALEHTYDPKLIKLGTEVKTGAIFYGFHKKWGHVVIKIQTSSNELDEVLHEGIVGLYATNNLRTLTPCFSLVYEVGRSKKNIVVYERIGGFSLLNYIANPNVKVQKAKKILLTLFVGLNIACKQVEFTHYDLHSQNIIIKKVEKPVDISYNCKKLFSTTQIPVIIDYGRAHVKIGNRSYGYNEVSMGEFEDDKFFIQPKGFWPHDVFQLLSEYYRVFSREGLLAWPEIQLQNDLDSLENTQTTIDETDDPEEKEYLKESLEFWESKVARGKENITKIRSELSKDTKERQELTQSIKKLMEYIRPSDTFSYMEILEELGRFSHLVPNKHNTSLDFDEFMEYAIKLLND